MSLTEPGKGTVLAVDDQLANLVALDAVLGTDFNLIRAHSGPEAIEILQRRDDVDVILMDVQMPVMDGFETASRMKALDGFQDIPIIFITAVYNEDPFIKKGYSVGAVDYFGKPFDPEILKVKVGIYASFRQKAAMLKERARQLRESEQLLDAGRRLSTTWGRTRVGVAIADLDGVIRRISTEAFEIGRDLLGVDDNAAVLGWWNSASNGVCSRASIARVLEKGDSSQADPADVRCVDGRAKTMHCAVSPLRGIDGRVVGAVLLVHDQTESLQVGEDFEKRINRLISSAAAAPAS